MSPVNFLLPLEGMKYKLFQGPLKSLELSVLKYIELKCAKKTINSGG